jgi:AAA domain, putative AbiEii toxin, Type IV TA system
MLDQLHLSNFRKFAHFQIHLRAGNILVGPNNAGKSSILDAFRLLEACFRHSKTRNPSLVQIDGGSVFYGYDVPESILPFSLANVTHDYNDDDAVVEFKHANKARAVIRLHPDRATRFYIDNGGGRLTTSSKFRASFPIDLVIVPTLAPLEAEERWVEDRTVRANATTRLASRVLRNIWLRSTDDEFQLFREEVERAWPTIRLKRPELRHSTPLVVEMFYSENRIDREVQWAGFGFQVWMQIQSHIRRGNSHSCLVIDEPDIYLHPDLQRRFLRQIRGKFQQSIMATHAIEIINDADPDEIVSINPSYRSGKRIHSDDDYAALYRYLGSTDNADFARIARARKVIFVEGKDGRLLRRLASRLGLDHLSDPQSVPIVQLGGFSEWRRALNATWAFKTVLDLDIDVFCLFDRDYRCDEEIESFLLKVSTTGAKVRVLDQKEIENYLLVPAVIERTINRRRRHREPEATNLTTEEVSDLICKVSDEFKIKVMSQRIANVLHFTKSQGNSVDQSTVIGQTSAIFEGEWADLKQRLRRVPGKDFLSQLNERLQEAYRISVTEAMLVEQLSRSLIDPGLFDILQALDEFCRD